MMTTTMRRKRKRRAKMKTRTTSKPLAQTCYQNESSFTTNDVRMSVIRILNSKLQAPLPY